MKKISLILMGVLLLSATTNVFASGLTIEEIVKGSTVEVVKNNTDNKESLNFTPELKAFSDVPTSHWAHVSIMEMAKRGILHTLLYKKTYLCVYFYSD